MSTVGGPDLQTGPSGRVLPFFGLVAYAAVGLVFGVAGVFFVPLPWSLPLWGGWFAGLWLTYRLMRQRSRWSIAAAPAALVVLWAYLEAGWAWWGWTAQDLPLTLR